MGGWLSLVLCPPQCTTLMGCCAMPPTKQAPRSPGSHCSERPGARGHRGQGAPGGRASAARSPAPPVEARRGQCPTASSLRAGWAAHQEMVPALRAVPPGVRVLHVLQHQLHVLLRRAHVACGHEGPQRPEPASLSAACRLNARMRAWQRRLRTAGRAARQVLVAPLLRTAVAVGKAGHVEQRCLLRQVKGMAAAA